MTTPQLAESSKTLNSLGVAAVDRYFERFNAGEYSQVATLFAADGRLYPPFEDPVVGAKQVETYLIQEADGMVATPISAETQPLEDGNLQVDVKGQVTALVFKVNVGWQFILTSDHQIVSVRVNLLASLEELLSIRPSKQR